VRALRVGAKIRLKNWPLASYLVGWRQKSPERGSGGAPLRVLEVVAAAGNGAVTRTGLANWGVNVMITVLGDLETFSLKNWLFSCKKHVMIIFVQELLLQ
jgi:hypothetical protein